MPSCTTSYNKISKITKKIIVPIDQFGYEWEEYVSHVIETSWIGSCEKDTGFIIDFFADTIHMIDHEIDDGGNIIVAFSVDVLLFLPKTDIGIPFTIIDIFNQGVIAKYTDMSIIIPSSSYTGVLSFRDGKLVSRKVYDDGNQKSLEVGDTTLIELTNFKYVDGKYKGIGKFVL
jgi:DNA-directed RNA polymerase subunit E'/Rpb7